MKKDFVSTVFTKNKLTCSGCGACAQICKHKAITMEEDFEGFLYPNVDSNRCTRCGLCDTICPEVNSHHENIFDKRIAYFVCTDIKEYYKKSATIGICTMLSDEMLNKGGNVYGAELDEKDWRVNHVCITDISDRERIRNSKYVQSNTKDTYFRVLLDLKEGKQVLFIGTPCQIAGLKSFLRKDYENLLTVDLICHGTFSYKLLQKEIDYWQNKLHGKINNFRFRSKRIYPWNKGGIVNFDITNKKGRTKHIERHGSCSPTYRCYAYSGDGVNYNLRPSCYNCSFRAIGRYGDLTVGDAWFIKKQGFYNDCKNGISLLFCNTPKGIRAIDNIRHLIDIEAVAYEQAFVQPALLPANREIPEERNYLYANLDKVDYGALIESVLSVNFQDIETKFKRKERVAKIKKLVKRIVFHSKWNNKNGY